MALGCSFTGHRNIKAEHEAALPELVLRAIGYAYERGCRTFYSGGAVGFDTVAAREVIRFRMTHPDVRLVILVPCINQDAAWSYRQREAYSYILSSADEVIFVSSEPYRDGCMRERNRRLVELADILICYASRRNSGAGQTVTMADKLNKEIYNLYPYLLKNENNQTNS